MKFEILFRFPQLSQETNKTEKIKTEIKVIDLDYYMQQINLLPNQNTESEKPKKEEGQISKITEK